MSKYELKCPDCGYHWKEEWEDYPSCHWESRCPGDVAPCDEEPYYEEDNDEEDWFEDEENWR